MSYKIEENKHNWIQKVSKAIDKVVEEINTNEIIQLNFAMIVKVNSYMLVKQSEIMIVNLNINSKRNVPDED